MSSIDKQLLEILRKIKNRIHLRKVLEYSLLGVIVALCISIVTVGFSRFFPIYKPYDKVAVICIIGTAIAIIFGFFKRPDSKSTALVVDALGLKERVITAVGLIGEESIIAQLEKKDTLDKLKKLDYKKALSIKPKTTYLSTCIVLISLLGILSIIPNSMTAKANELHDIKEKIYSQKNKIEKITKEIKKEIGISQKDKIEIEKKLQELKKNLNQAKSVKDMDKALKKTEKNLEFLRKEKAEKQQQLNNIIDTLAKNQSTKGLAEVLKNKNIEQIKKEINKLSDKLKNIDEKEIEMLSKELLELSKDLEQNPQLAEAIAGLSQKLQAGELGNINSELGELSGAMEQLINEEKMEEALGKLSQQLQNMQSNQNQANQEGDSDNGNISLNPLQNNKSGSEGSQGNGSTEGGNGTSNGTGTGNGTGNNGSNSSNGSGLVKKGSSERKEGEYEKIFTPETLGGNGQHENLNGQKSSEGNMEQTTSNKSLTVRGNLVPYNQVLGQYKQSSLESIKASNVPSGMKDIVKDYFSSLGE